MREKTAVNYLAEQLEMIIPINQFNDILLQDAIKNAKEIEQMQIIETYDEAEGKILGNGYRYYKQKYS